MQYNKMTSDPLIKMKIFHSFQDTAFPIPTAKKDNLVWSLNDQNKYILGRKLKVLWMSSGESKNTEIREI